jgi:UDP:flavonoid glycosyltransferase YjiC (YdhE family)
MGGMRLLCLPYSPTLSHVSRLLALAGTLRSAGVEVVFAGSGKEMRHVEAARFSTVDLWEPPQEELFGAIRARKLRFVSRATLRRMVEADLGLYRDLHPTAVLSDGRFSAPISTQVASIAHGAVVNASSTRFRSLPYMPLFAAPGAWLSPLRPGLVRVEYTLFDLFMGVFRSVAREFGVPGATTPTDCLTGRDLTLMPDLPEFFPTRALPSHYYYIGPLTWRPTDDVVSVRGLPDEDDAVPLVYLTLGTTGDGAFLRAARDLLAASPYRVVITTAGQAPGLQPVPAKIWVADYADGDALCRRARVVVCHGGNGTIYQALRHGRPIVGIPGIPDQQYNMRRVEALGLGCTVSLREFRNRPACLVEAIEGLLADSDTRGRCRALQERMTSLSPADRGAELAIAHLLQ